MSDPRLTLNWIDIVPQASVSTGRNPASAALFESDIVPQASASTGRNPPSVPSEPLQSAAPQRDVRFGKPPRVTEIKLPPASESEMPQGVDTPYGRTPRHLKTDHKTSVRVNQRQDFAPSEGNSHAIHSIATPFIVRMVTRSAVKLQKYFRGNRTRNKLLAEGKERRASFVAQLREERQEGSFAEVAAVNHSTKVLID